METCPCTNQYCLGGKKYCNSECIDENLECQDCDINAVNRGCPWQQSCCIDYTALGGTICFNDGVCNDCDENSICASGIFCRETEVC